MRRPGVALTRTQLLDGAWDIAFESRSNVVDVYVRYLREKIDRPFGATRSKRCAASGTGCERLIRDPAADPDPAHARLRARDGAGPRCGWLLRLPARGERAARGPSTRRSRRRRRSRSGRAKVDADTGGGTDARSALRRRRARSERHSRATCHRCSIPISSPRPTPGALYRNVTRFRAPRRVARPRRPGTRAARASSSLARSPCTADELARPPPPGAPPLPPARAARCLSRRLRPHRPCITAGRASATPRERCHRRAADAAARPPERGRDLSPRHHAERHARAPPGAPFEHERRFVADASHELRTPLALLQTELELALRRPRPQRSSSSALRSAAEETQRLTRLADDLLLIARADQGPLPIRREAIAARRPARRRRPALREPRRLAGPRAAGRAQRRSFSTPTPPPRAGAREPRRERTHVRRGRRPARAPSSRPARSSFTSRTRVRGSRKTSVRGPSTASAAPTRRAAAAAPVSASRSSS